MGSMGFRGLQPEKLLRGGQLAGDTHFCPLRTGFVWERRRSVEECLSSDCTTNYHRPSGLKTTILFLLKKIIYF